jgi:hypothetical protein
MDYEFSPRSPRNPFSQRNQPTENAFGRIKPRADLREVAAKNKSGLIGHDPIFARFGKTRYRCVGCVACVD